MKVFAVYLICFFVFVLNLADASTIYHGNTKTMTYHQPGCRYYNCQSCTAFFDSWEDAEHAGYKHCKVCVVPYPPPATPEPSTPRQPPEPPPNFKEALQGLLICLLGLLVAQLFVFFLYNCFLEKNLSLFERWKRFQGWLIGKSTKVQLKKRMEQVAMETERLEQSRGIKNGILHVGYLSRALLFRINQFAGGLVNFILVGLFLLVSWVNVKYVMIYGWEWIQNMMG